MIVRWALSLSAPLVTWYVGSVAWDALQLTDYSQLRDPHKLAELLMPAALAAKPIPMWVNIMVASGLVISFVACVVALLRSLFKAERELTQRQPSAAGAESHYPGPFLWPLLLVVSIAITFDVRPAHQDIAALGGTALTIGVVSLLLGAGATVVIVGVRRPAGSQPSSVAPDTNQSVTVSTPTARDTTTHQEPPRTLDQLVASGRIALVPLANAAAQGAQRAHTVSTWLFRGTMILIVAALAAAILAPQLPGTRAAAGARLLTALAALVCVVLTGVLAIVRLVSRIDDRRMVLTALSGAAMSLSWRYAVGGKPLEVIPAAAEESIDRYYDRLIAQTLQVTEAHTSLSPSDLGSLKMTSDMRVIRASDLDHRRAMYVHGRLESSHEYYSKRAQQASRLIARWSGVTLGLIALCAACVVAELVGALPPYSAGIPAACVLVGFCWIERASYESQARKDAALLVRLKALHARCVDRREWSEATWSEFVDSAETALLSAQDAYLLTTL